MDSDLHWRLSCPSSIRDKHLHLLNSGNLSDVTFLVGDTREPISAHKFILIVASPVFETQFGERWEHENKIEIPEVSPKAFRMFLEYLYADMFSVTVTEIEVTEVLFLAHKYLINCLVRKCTDLLTSVINVSNVILIHQTAAEFNEKILEKKAMEFILKNGTAVFEDIGFLQIDKDTLSSILKCDRLVTEDIVIFRAVMRWAERKCEEEKLDLTVQNKRIVLKDLIPLIRFTLMTPEEFTNEVCLGKHEGILSDAESNSVYKYWNVGPSMRTHLPTLPFNLNKRCLENLYMVDLSVHEASVEFSYGSNCRSVHTHSCEEILRFRTNISICVKAIELRLRYQKGRGRMSPTYLELADSGSVDSEESDICGWISMSDTPSLNKNLKRKRKGKFVHTFSLESEYGSGFWVERDVNYKIGVIINNSLGAGSGRTGVGLELANSVQVMCEEGNVEFNFMTVSTKCGRPRHTAGEPSDCICDGLIKRIHFTI